MERNKWEEEFKEKLNQREITPTPHAWDRLDAMLNEKESKRPVRRLGWLYVAAGFAGLVLMATLFFKQENANDLPVADQPKKEIEQTQNPENVFGDSAATGKTHAAEAAPNQKPATQHKRIRLQGQIRNEVQLAQENVKKPDMQTNDSGSEKGNPKININPTDVKADEQLASVDTKLHKPKTVKVDPSSLLSQVDGELELTFREKAIKAVNRNYQTVKVALANRNNIRE